LRFELTCNDTFEWHILYLNRDNSVGVSSNSIFNFLPAPSPAPFPTSSAISPSSALQLSSSLLLAILSTRPPATVGAETWKTRLIN
jgi:hypothetical protein